MERNQDVGAGKIWKKIEKNVTILLVEHGQGFLNFIIINLIFKRWSLVPHNYKKENDEF